MRIFQYIIPIMLFSSCLFYPGGGGGKYNPPRIVTNEINLQKEEFQKDTLSIREKQILQFRTTTEPTHGYLKKENKAVFLLTKNDYPQTKLFCKTSSDQLLWELTSDAYPFNSVEGIYFYQSSHETEIYILWGLRKQFMTIHNEAGEEKNKIELGNLSTHYSDPTVFSFLNEKYIIVQSGSHVAILDLNGNLVKKINLPRYPVSQFAREVYGRNNEKYLLLWVDQQSTSHSSSLFIISNTWDIIYMEYLLGAEWVGFSEEIGKNSFIIKSESEWIPNGVWIQVGGPWKYTFK